MDSTGSLEEFLLVDHPSAESPPQPPPPAVPNLSRLRISPRFSQSRAVLTTPEMEPGSGGGGGQNNGASTSSSSATISETKKMGKFKFLTVTPAAENGAVNGDSIAGVSPYQHEPSSAESCDEPVPPGPSSGVPRSNNRGGISLRRRRKPLPLNPASPTRSQLPTLSVGDTGEFDRSTSLDMMTMMMSANTASGEVAPRDDEDLIDKHVQRLLKVTEHTDNNLDAEEDFEEEDDDFDSRLDQMIAEEERTRKKGRRRTVSKSVGMGGRRRSTRNSRKDEVATQGEEGIPATGLEGSNGLDALISLEPKKRGRRRKVVPAAPSSELGTDEPSEREPSVAGKDTSDDAASQMSEVKPDSEDLSDPRPGKPKSRWVEQVLAVPIEEVPVVEDLNLKMEEPVPPAPLPDLVVSPVPVPPVVVSPAMDSVEGTYHVITDCVRLSRHKIRDDREARKMRCDCVYTADEAQYGMKGCTEACLNRMLYIECGPKCPAKDDCANKRFQRKEYAALEVFKTDLKGHGIRTKYPLAAGQFICEYVGEVLDAKQFKKRQREYHDENIQHHYFMALNSDEVIDATRKGNCTRFTNHSCDPNSETQKWTVGGNLRIGFFTLRPVAAGEEITFDYQFERYGKKAQRCFCGTTQCRGFIGSVASDDRKKVSKGDISDRKMVSEIEKFVQMASLRTADQALRMARLLLRVEEDHDRRTLLRVIQNSENQDALRGFMRCQGLTILADFMYACRNSSVDMKLEILNTLRHLPIVSRNILEDSTILDSIKRWAGHALPNPLLSASSFIPATPDTPDIPTAKPWAPSSSVPSPASWPRNGNDSLPEPIDVEQLEREVFASEESQKGDAVVSSEVKVEVIDEDLQSQSTEDLSEPPSSDRMDCGEDELVMKAAADLLQYFEPLKSTFRIPKKLITDREPLLEEPSRKAPVKANSTPTTNGLAGGAHIPIVGGGYSRGKRSPSPTTTVSSSSSSSQPVEGMPVRPKHPRFGHQHHYNNNFQQRPPFQQQQQQPYLGGGGPRRPMGMMGGSLFPHHVPSFLQQQQQMQMQSAFGSLVSMETTVASLASALLQQQPQLSQPDLAALAEAARVQEAEANNKLVAKLVSDCLLLNTVAPTKKVTITLPDGSSHEARSFKPTAVQIARLYADLPVIGSAEWEARAAQIRERSGQMVQAMDAPITQEVIGWMSNFDLSKHFFLPKDWCAAYDRVGRLYFYNTSNGISRWDFPCEDHEYSTVLTPLSGHLSIPADLKDYTTVPAASMTVRPWSPQGDADDDSPRENNIPSRSSHFNNSSRSRGGKFDRHRPAHHRRPDKSEASKEALRQLKIDFQNDVCKYVLQVLNVYRHAQCTEGRIETKEDFKYLARKFTHNVLEQEIKRHRNAPDALRFSTKHKPKIKEHVRKYMSRFGKVYKPVGGGEARTREEENRRNLVDDGGEGEEEEEGEGDDDDEDDEMEDEVQVAAAETTATVLTNGVKIIPDDETDDTEMVDLKTSGEPVDLAGEVPSGSDAPPFPVTTVANPEADLTPISNSLGMVTPEISRLDTSLG